MAVGRDAVGTTYLLLLVERGEAADRYACVPVSPSRLEALRSGSIELRTAFEEIEAPDRYVATYGLEGPAGLTLEPTDTFSEEWLPGHGFRLEPPENIEQASELAASARQRNRAVVDIELEPPGVSEAGVIGADTLSSALHFFQQLVRLAHRKVVATLPGDLRSVLQGDENAALEVAQFAEGSFKVRLQSMTTADLLGAAGVSRALHVIDELTENIERTDLAFDAAVRNRGHLVYGYQRLLQFISQNRTPMSYSWADPERGAVRPVRIPVLQAEALYSMLVAKRELSHERTVLVGSFVRASRNDGTWAVVTEDGQEYRGRTAEEANVSLNGVTIGTHRYELACEEHIEETAGSGRHATRLLLVGLRELTS